MAGEAAARFRFAANGPPPPSYENNGFRQDVEPAPGGWSVTVRVSPGPLPVRAPFRPVRLPAGLGLSPTQARDLAGGLAPAQRQNEAVDAVMLFLKRHLGYLERPGFDEQPRAVFARGEASCVGLTRAAVAILGALGIRSREVLGLRIPPGEERTVIQGGMLHAWLEVDYPGAGSVFYDPLRSCGWVGPGYVVLRRGDGLAPGPYEAYTGGTVTCEARNDRIFFEPSPGTSCVLWARPAFPGFTGTLVTGKVLGGLDRPLSGSATLAGDGASATMALWEGNFFFRDLEPGNYLLTLELPGRKPTSLPVRLSGMDKDHLVFYSRSDGTLRAGAADEPGR